MERIHTISYDVESERGETRLSPEPRVDSVDAEAEDRLLDLMRLLWGERQFLWKFGICAAIVTLLISLLLPTTYRSTTLLMPPDDQSGTKANLAMMAGMASKMSGGGSDIGMLAGDLLGTRTTGDLFLGILHSRTAQEGLVDQFDLTRVYGFPWLGLRAQQEDARKQLEFNTETSQERKSGLITIAVTDRDPKRAAALAEGYVGQLNRLLASVSTSAAGRERQFLERRLEEVKKDLDDSVNQLSQFSSKNITFDPAIQGKATVETVAAMEGELVAAESQLRGLQTIYTDESVRVRGLQARVTELRKQLGALSGRTEVDASASSFEATDSAIPFPSLRQLPLLGAKYAGLFRRVKIEETVYQILTQQYELAKVQEAKEIPTVRVVDRAQVPPRKWGPHRMAMALIGGIAGLLFGCAWVIGVERWNEHPSDDPRKLFLSEVFSVVGQLWIWRKSEATLRKVVSFSRHLRPASNNSGSAPQ